MTISISVSVNGNYKVPITTKYRDGEPTTEVISGRGHPGPNVKHIPYYHGSDAGNVVNITVGPEEHDDAEAEAETAKPEGLAEAAQAVTS